MNNNKSNCGTGYEVVLHVARMSVFRAGVREAFDHIIDVSVHVIERSLLMASHQQRSCALDFGGRGLLSQGSAVRLATENSFHYLGEAAVPHALDKVLHCSTARLRESQCECDLGLLHPWQTQVFFSFYARRFMYPIITARMQVARGSSSALSSAQTCIIMLRAFVGLPGIAAPMAV